jgi:hypothetical protein
MEHRTDEEREGLGADPDEDTAAPEEDREPSAEGDVTTATAVAEQEGADEEGGAEEDQEPTAEGDVTTATAVAEEEEGAEAESGAEDQDTVPEGGSAVAAANGATTNGTAPSSEPETEPETESVELYTDSDMEEFRRRWTELLAGFVDDPRASAERADGLIGELVDRVSQRRQQLHDALDNEDDRGETEAMRQAIRRYRSIYRALVRE